MQQQQQQPGSQYGSQSPTDLTPFPSRPQFSTIHPDAPSPISSRPPPVQNFGELATTAAGAFHEDDVLAAGEDAERGGTPGNRWPREETLALLKIRSEMDAAFKDASLKGPLWENVSRKLGELGYIRSAKKCKEKFENVHKYYKRTKEGRAGRQDGKSYRFFTQLEALHTTSGGGLAITGSGSGSSTPTTAMPNPIPALPAATVAPTWASIQPSPPPSITAPLPPPPAHAATPAPSTMLQPQPQPQPQPHSTGVTGGISFSSDTFSSSSYESDDEDTEEGEGRKRKRGSGGPGGSRKMMAFFEGLMMQVMQKQEAMQQRFLETIEKREQDRTAREEAWKRQELARLNREHEMLAQERAVAASRDAALISFLQKIGGGQAVPVPPPAAPSPRPPPVQSTPPPPRPAVVHIAPPPPPPPAPAPAPAPALTQPPEQMVQKETQQPIQQHQHIAPAPPPAPVQQQQAPPRQIDEIVIAHNPPSSSCTELVPVPEQQETVATPRGALELGVSPSRWPKSEVHALIKLRSGLEGRYQEAGPKGPLWEEISAGMQRLGYNRSSKRCKEKWENINKYFKKVKESNKKRPEDAKTCPYFHQLDALYRKKNLGSTSNPGYSIENNPQTPPPPSQPLLPPQPQQLQAPQPIQTQQTETERKSETEKNAGNPGGAIQIQTSNGGLPSSFFEGGAGAMNKPEDIMKELMEQQHRRQAAMNNYNKMEQPHTDHNMYQDDEDDDDEDDEDDEDANMVYKMQFERQNVGNGGGGGGNASAKPAATTTAGSFLGMVQ